MFSKCMTQGSMSVYVIVSIAHRKAEIWPTWPKTHYFWTFTEPVYTPHMEWADWNMSIPANGHKSQIVTIFGSPKDWNLAIMAKNSIIFGDSPIQFMYCVWSPFLYWFFGILNGGRKPPIAASSRPPEDRDMGNAAEKRKTCFFLQVDWFMKIIWNFKGTLRDIFARSVTGRQRDWHWMFIELFDAAKNWHGFSYPAK